MAEPKITINGQALSDAEAMTVRVAIGSFAMDLQDGLGDDEMGRAICEAYKRALRLIFAKMHTSGADG